MSRRVREHLRSNVVGYIAIFLFAVGGTASATHPGGVDTISTEDIIDGAVFGSDVADDTVAGGGLGRVDLKAGSVRSSEITDASVQTADIATGGVESIDVLDDSLTNADLGTGSVGGDEVTDNTLGTADLGTGSVGGDEVINNSVTTDDVAALHGDNDIQDNTISGFDIDSDSVDSDEVVDFGLSNADVGILFAEVNANGTLANSSGGVTTAKISPPAGNYEVDFGRNIAACAAVATIGPAGTGSFTGEVNVADRNANVEAVFVDTNDSAGVSADRPFRLVVVC